MTTQTPPTPPELTTHEAAAGLRARAERLRAENAQNYDSARRKEILYLNAALQILTDFNDGVFDDSTWSQVTAILTEEPVRESFIATPELVAWLAQHPEWGVNLDVGDEVLDPQAWDTDSALALAAEAMEAFEDANPETAAIAFQAALAERGSLVADLEGFFTFMGHNLDD